MRCSGEMWQRSAYAEQKAPGQMIQFGLAKRKTHAFGKEKTITTTGEREKRGAVVASPDRGKKHTHVHTQNLRYERTEEIATMSQQQQHHNFVMFVCVAVSLSWI